MKKRVWSLLTALCLVLALLPVTALAGEGAILRVSGSGTELDGNYESIADYTQKIMSMANSLSTHFTITLLDDIEVTDMPLMIFNEDGDKSVSTILDLAGHTVTVNGKNSVGVYVYSTRGNDSVIQNGKIVLATDGAVGINNYDGTLTVSGVEIVASEGVISAIGIMSNYGQSAANAFIENSVIMLGKNNTDVLDGNISSPGYYTTIISGQFTADPVTESNGIQYAAGSSTLTANPEGVAGTIITSPATTSMIVRNGSAYLYDTLQEAVNAVEPDGTIQLLRQPGDQSVTVPIHAKFCVIGFGDADVDVSADLFATEEGYQVIVDKDGWVYVEEADIPVTDISLNRTWLTLTKGETAGLTATVSPSNATDKDVTWISSDTAIATVADGTVTAVAPGTATITATAGGKSATCTVTVTAAQQPSTPSTSDRDDDDDGYSISVPASSSIRGGSITVSPRRADRDDTVTITVTPDDGYVLDELSVTTRGGDALSLRQRDDSQYTFEMPAGSVVIHVSFMEQSSTPAEEMLFSDVPSDFWAYNEIQWAFENGYMNGTTSTTFVPGGAVTRQQVWMILARMAGSNPVDMAAARAWAVNNGISDGTNPGAAVTRQQLVALLYRFAAQNGYDTTARADLSGYPDVASVASYAADAMAWSVAEGIVGGTTQGTLNPAGTANRAQFAVILWRFYQTSAN